MLLVAPGRQGRGEHGGVVSHRGIEDLRDRPALAGCGHQVGGPVDVVGAQDHVDVGGPLPHALLVLLGQAAADHDLQVGLRVLARLQVAEGAVQAVVGVLPDAAGVEHDDVGVVLGCRLDQAVVGQQRGDALRVVLVHLAPERADEELPRGHPEQATAGARALIRFPGTP